MPATSEGTTVPSLCCYCLGAAADNIGSVASAQALTELPEELCTALLEAVMERGKLTPRVLECFEQSQHEAVLARVQQLGISKWTPPLAPTTPHGWLGQKPPWW